MSAPPPVPGIVLAAGASTRLGGGRAKQLLVTSGGETLLRRAARVAVEAAGPGTPVVVVLGHRAEEMTEELAGLPVGIVRADHWWAGMGASLKAGLRAALAAAPGAAGVVVSLCDQPLVTAAHLAALRRLPRGDAVAVVAAEYGGGPGVPAFFGREVFPALRELADAGGARIFLRREAYAGRLLALSLPEAARDVDTPADAESFLR